MSLGSLSLLERPQDRGHPHRCQAGHRWQHAGPTAVTCAIPAFDSAGDLPCVDPQDCPVCCGRDDVLVRGVHTHYCNICDGDWEHEGRCLEGLPAWCPWCFPTDESPPPGARTGSHYHYCPECGTNWRHATACSAPLEAALSDCSGCLGRHGRGAVSPAFRRNHVVRPRNFVRPLVLTFSLAGCVLLSVPILIKGWPGLSARRPPIVETPTTGIPPAATEPEPARTPEPARSVERGPASPTAPEQAQQVEKSVTLVPPREPPPRREGVSAGRAREISPPPPRVNAPTPALGGGATDSPPAPVPVSPVLPPASRAPEPIVDSPSPTVTVHVAEPVIPGAPPPAVQGGASGWEIFLESHPRPGDRPARLENRAGY